MNKLNKICSLLLAIIFITSVMFNMTLVSANPIDETENNFTDNNQQEGDTNGGDNTDPEGEPGEDGDGEGEEEEEEIEHKDIDFDVDTDQGFEKVASTESLDLYFDKEEIAIRVDVKDDSGNVTKSWRSQLSPKNLHITEDTDPNTLNEFDRQSMSFMIVDYINLNKLNTKPVSASTFELKPELENLEKTGAGIKFLLNFKTLNMKIPVAIEIVGNEMDVRIPKEGFYENTEGYKLVSEAKDIIRESVNEIQKISTNLRRELEKVMKEENSFEVMVKELVLGNLNKLYHDVLDLENASLGDQYTDLEPDTLRNTVSQIERYTPNEEDYQEKTDRLAELVETCIEQFDIMKNNMAFGVLKLVVMPYFGFGTTDTDGYVFYPDGSGAISYFNVVHPRYVGNYNRHIYFEHDLDLVKLKSYDYKTRNFASMPVYGVKHENDGFAAIITDGDYDATINYIPATPEYSISRVYSTYIYRRQVKYLNNNASTSTMFEVDKLDYTRNTKYVFLTGEDASYSGMARTYRDYLNGNNNSNEQLLNKAINKDDNIPFAVDFLMGVRPYTDVLIRKTIKMTTYEQAKEALENFRKDGVKGKIYTNLIGWTKAGAYEEYPDQLKISKELGGEDNFKELTSYAKENNIQLSLTFDPIQAYRSDISWGDLNYNVVKDRVNTPIEGYSWYFFSPKYIQNRFAEKQLETLLSYGANSVNLTTIGNLIYYDFNTEYGGDRKFTAERFRDVTKLANEKLGGSVVNTGNAYILKYATKINSVPFEDSGYFFSDETVPFYQMVVHGSIPYTGTPYNLLHDEGRQKLQFIENGSLPYFYLTHEPADEMRYTNIFYVDNLYTSEISNWYDKAVEVYNEFNEVLSGVWYETIDEHEILQEDVKKITYSNGTVIYLNYTNNEVTVENITIEPVSYKVVKGGVN